MIKLTNIRDRITADSLIALLEDNNIIAYSQAPYIGAYQNVKSNHSFYGYDIYVSEEDFDQAKELLQLIQPDENQVSEDCNETIENKENNVFSEMLVASRDRQNKFFTARRIYVSILLIAILSSLAYTFIGNIKEFIKLFPSI